MSEMFTGELDGLPEQFHPDEGGNRLGKKTAPAIDRMQYEMRNNFLTVLLGSVAISFIAGYFISRRY